MKSFITSGHGSLSISVTLPQAILSNNHALKLHAYTFEDLDIHPRYSFACTYAKSARKGCPDDMLTCWRILQVLSSKSSSTGL